MNLTKNVVIAEVLAPVGAASNTDSNSSIVDTQDCEGVVFIVPITDSVDTGVATLTAQQNTANSDTGMAGLSGAVATATSAANDDLNGQLLIVDVYRPRERYVQGTLTSATANIAFGNMIAIKYGVRKAPVTSDSTVSSVATAISPAEA